MNQHGSDAPREDRGQQASDHSDANSGPSGPGQPATEEAGRDEPIAAKLADPTDESPVRVGSPFAVDPVLSLPARRIEVLYDVGPVRYTARGAVAAAVMLIGFAGAAAWWFPAGGALIAALGCVLSILGLYSTHRIASAGLLVIHLCLFVLSYGRSLG